MTTEHTAQQLELAAQILRTGHPWGYRHIAGGRYKYNTPIEVVADGNFLSPLLATPPDGRPLHNPDNLDAETVGVGYRLTVEGESPHGDAETWDSERRNWRARLLPKGSPYVASGTYRLPLSVPWPEVEKPDPYAELKAAHAAGKVIQWFNGTTWLDLIKPVDPNPLWLHPAKDLRIKPEEPAFQLSDQAQLPPPPPGMRWHREDGWTADDLPQGYRPLVDGENWVARDEILRFAPHGWQIGGMPGDILDEPTHSRTSRCRTTRPLVFNHAGKTWTYHRPGDPMPCDGERMVHILTRDNDFSKEPSKAEDYEWNQIEGSGRFAEIIGWRYAEPQTKTVTLGPEDVPPGSVIRGQNWALDWGKCWLAVLETTLTGVHCNRGDEHRFTSLQFGWQINRSIPLTGKWNPDAWEPCSKTIPADDNLAEPKSR